MPYGNPQDQLHFVLELELPLLEIDLFEMSRLKVGLWVSSVSGLQARGALRRLAVFLVGLEQQGL